MQRQRGGRLPGQIGDRIERVEVEIHPPPGLCATHRTVEHTQLQRGLRQRRSQPQVVTLVEGRYPAALGVGGCDRPGQLHRRALPAVLHQLPGGQLQLVAFQGTAQPTHQRVVAVSVGDGPQRQQVILEYRRIDGGRGRLDLMAELLQQERGRLGRRRHLRVHLAAEGRVGRPADSQPARFSSHLVSIGPRRGGSDVGIARGRAGGDIQQQCAVTYRAGDRVHHGQTEQWVAEVRSRRDPRSGRLQAVHPAARRGNSDRSGTIAGAGGSGHAGRDRDGRPSAGSAGGALQVPRVATRSVRLGLRRGVVAELG